MREAKKEAEELANAYRSEKEAAYQASMQKVILQSTFYDAQKCCTLWYVNGRNKYP